MQSTKELSTAESHADWWARMRPEDRAYMLAPRDWPDPCAWCGGRLRHNADCVSLTWREVMPFGKHKGRAIEDVPTEYLSWLLRSPVHLSPEVYEAAVRRLEEARAA